jgi:hypothetical protein
MKEKYQKTIQEWIDGITVFATITGMLFGFDFLVRAIGYQVAAKEYEDDFMYFVAGSEFLLLCLFLIGVLLLICYIFKTLGDCCKFILTEYKDYKKDKTGLLTPLIAAKI